MEGAARVAVVPLDTEKTAVESLDIELLTAAVAAAVAVTSLGTEKVAVRGTVLVADAMALGNAFVAAMALDTAMVAAVEYCTAVM